MTQSAGQMDPQDIVHEYNDFVFRVNRILAKVRTTVWVKVIAFQANNNPLIPGTVTVQPVINMMDGSGNATSHGQISNIPVLHCQGGGNAIIIDPAAGDVGLLLVSDRDTSSARSSSGAISNPGSFRRFDMADGVYIGGMFGVAPTQYLRFNSNGASLIDKNGNSIALSNSGINLTPQGGQLVTASGPVKITQTLEVDGASDLKGALHVENTVNIDNALSALSLGLNSGGKITRINSASFGPVSGSVPAAGQVTTNFTVPGAQAGDFVIPNYTTYSGGQFIVTFQTIGGGTVVATITNAINTSSNVWDIAGSLLVLGVT